MSCSCIKLVESPLLLESWMKKLIKTLYVKHMSDKQCQCHVCVQNKSLGEHKSCLKKKSYVKSDMSSQVTALVI